MDQTRGVDEPLGRGEGVVVSRSAGDGGDQLGKSTILVETKYGGGGTSKGPRQSMIKNQGTGNLGGGGGGGRNTGHNRTKGWCSNA